MKAVVQKRTGCLNVGVPPRKCVTNKPIQKNERKRRKKKNAVSHQHTERGRYNCCVLWPGPAKSSDTPISSPGPRPNGSYTTFVSRPSGVTRSNRPERRPAGHLHPSHPHPHVVSKYRGHPTGCRRHCWPPLPLPTPPRSPVPHPALTLRSKP